MKLPKLHQVFTISRATRLVEEKDPAEPAPKRQKLDEGNSLPETQPSQKVNIKINMSSQGSESSDFIFGKQKASKTPAQTSVINEE